MISRLPAVFLAALLASSGLMAQEAEEQLPEAKVEIVRNKNPVKIQVTVESLGPAATDEHLIHLIVSNDSEDTYEVESVEITLPKEVASLREYSPKVDCWQQQGAQQLKRNSSWSCLHRIAGSELGVWSQITDLRSLFFLPRDYPLAVILRYRHALPNRPYEQMIEMFTLRLEAPLGSLLRGGVLGSLLLGAFLLLYRLRGHIGHQGMRPQWNKAGSALLESFIVAALGSVAACALIVLLQRADEFPLPLSIRVTDYLGGMVLGLLSARGAEQLAARLLSRELGGSLRSSVPDSESALGNVTAARDEDPPV